MKLIIKRLRTNEHEITVVEGETPVFTFTTPEARKWELKLQSAEGKKIIFPKRVDTPFELTIDDSQLPGILNRFKEDLVNTNPIWQSDSAQTDFSHLQCLLSRMQTAKPQGHGVEIAIQQNIVGAPTGHDSLLLKEYQEIVAELKPDLPDDKGTIAHMAIEISRLISEKYPLDSVKEYGAYDKADKSLGLAVKCLQSDFLQSAVDGPVVITYIHKLLTHELPVGVICSIVQTLNDMMQKGQKTKFDVAYGEQEDYSCVDGLETRTALLRRVVKTKMRVEAEAKFIIATPANILKVAEGVSLEGLKRALIETEFEHLSFPKFKQSLKEGNTYYLQMIFILNSIIATNAQCLKTDFEKALEEALENYKQTTLFSTYGFTPEEADTLIAEIKPMLETFSLQVTQLLNAETKSPENKFKKTVEEEMHRAFPEGSAIGYLEQACDAILKSDILRDADFMAGVTKDLEERYKKHYKKELEIIIKEIVFRESSHPIQHSGLKFFPAPKVSGETLKRILKPLTERIEVEHLDCKDLETRKMIAKEAKQLLDEHSEYTYSGPQSV